MHNNADQNEDRISGSFEGGARVGPELKLKQMWLANDRREAANYLSKHWVVMQKLPLIEEAWAKTQSRAGEK